MNPYQRNSRWKTYLAIFAIVIIVASLIYTNYLASQIEREERKKIEIYAETLNKINEAKEGEDVSYYFDILNRESTIPMISVDENERILDYKNLNDERVKNDAYLQRQLESMRVAYAPIPLNQPDGTSHYIFYKGSKLLALLKWFPILQFLLIAVFLTTAYYLFSQARKSEQNLVWVGMSKETAHQLGTPIFSLMGWLEMLKASNDPEVKSYIPEMEKDIKRLELITDRFSKIGSSPTLGQHNIVDIVQETIDYFKPRSPKRIQFITEYNFRDIQVNLYPPLFNWVIENLIKNALDAMDSEGTIKTSIYLLENEVTIDIEDTGKGIASSNKNIVFRPGFSTKKRGWGLGLSLSKRIIEDYHHGKIFVQQSEKNKGTTFRIIMKSA